MQSRGPGEGGDARRGEQLVGANEISIHGGAGGDDAGRGFLRGFEDFFPASRDRTRRPPSRSARGVCSIAQRASFNVLRAMPKNRTCPSSLSLIIMRNGSPALMRSRSSMESCQMSMLWRLRRLSSSVQVVSIERSHALGPTRAITIGSTRVAWPTARPGLARDVSGDVAPVGDPRRCGGGCTLCDAQAKGTDASSLRPSTFIFAMRTPGTSCVDVAAKAPLY